MCINSLKKEILMSNITRYNPNKVVARPGLLGGSVFDSIFADFFSPDVFTTHLNKTVSGYPVADIYHNEGGATVMEFALAGFAKEDLTIDVQPEKRSITVVRNSFIKIFFSIVIFKLCFALHFC